MHRSGDSKKRTTLGVTVWVAVRSTDVALGIIGVTVGVSVVYGLTGGGMGVEEAAIAEDVDVAVATAVDIGVA